MPPPPPQSTRGHSSLFSAFEVRISSSNTSWPPHRRSPNWKGSQQKPTLDVTASERDGIISSFPSLPPSLRSYRGGQRGRWPYLGRGFNAAWKIAEIDKDWYGLKITPFKTKVSTCDPAVSPGWWEGLLPPHCSCSLAPGGGALLIFLSARKGGSFSSLLSLLSLVMRSRTKGERRRGKLRREIHQGGMFTETAVVNFYCFFASWNAYNI